MRGAWTSGKGAAWAVTLVAAAALLGLGWWLGRDSLAPGLEQAQQEAARQADRANRLLADNRSLERRLGALSRRLDQCRRQSPAPAPPAGEKTTTSRILTRGKAALELGGRLVITLEDISFKPRRAVLKVKVLGGKSGRVVLPVGSEVRFRVKGRIYALVLKQIFTSSVSYVIIPQ